MSRMQVGVFTLVLVALLAVPLSIGGVDAHATGTTTVHVNGGTTSIPANGGTTIPANSGTTVDSEIPHVPASSGDPSWFAPAPSDAIFSRGPGSQLIEADRIEFRITVFENASARWQFVYTRSLDNETERENFEAFAQNFNENQTEAFTDFQAQAEALTSNGRNQTGRDMDATDFSKRAFLGGDCIDQNNCGTVRMTFTWSAFARSDGSQLIVDDVFDGGLYVAEDQKLVFERGPNLAFESASPDSYVASGTSLADSTSITWQGEREFPDQRPRVVFGPQPESTTTAGNGPGDGSTATSPTLSSGPGSVTPSPTDRDPDQSGGLPVMLIGGVLVVLIGVGFAVVWARGSAGGAGTRPQPSGGNPPSAAASSTTETNSSEVTGEPAVPDEELLTDEDRVERMLRENGGRMKQVNIVDQTGWSKSKVSMLLSDMEDEGDISKLRVGRENIVSLAGHEPDAAGSPHEE